MNRAVLVLFVLCILVGGTFGILAGRGEFPFLQKRQQPEICLTCHQNRVQAEQLSPKAKGPTKLIFFHSSHVGTLKLSCSPCHAPTQEEAHRTRPEKPLCLTCHDGKLAGDGCLLCHEQGAPIQLTPEKIENTKEPRGAVSTRTD